jgi:hypothetical protein
MAPSSERAVTKVSPLLTMKAPGAATTAIAHQHAPAVTKSIMVSSI